MQRDRVTSSSGCIHTERDSSETRDHGKRLRAGSIPAVECTSQCPVSIVGRRQRNPPASARGDVWVSGRVEQLASNGRQNISYIEIPRDEHVYDLQLATIVPYREPYTVHHNSMYRDSERQPQARQTKVRP